MLRNSRAWPQRTRWRPCPTCKLTAPLTIEGVFHSAGDVVGIALPALHFNPDVWTEPESFDPERFLTGKAAPFGYAPFGGGYRRCVGAVFAHHELAVAVGTLMKTVELSMQSGSGGTFVTSRQSGNDGYFSFAGLPAGTYFLNTSGKTGPRSG